MSSTPPRPASLLQSKIATAVALLSAIVVLIIAVKSTETHKILMLGAGVAVIVSIVNSAHIVAKHLVIHKEQWNNVVVHAGSSSKSYEAFSAASENMSSVGGVATTVSNHNKDTAALVFQLNDEKSKILPDAIVTSVEERRLILRLILLIPIYSVMSFFSLAFPKYSPIFDQISELYEALTALFFFQLLLTFFVDDDQKSSSSSVIETPDNAAVDNERAHLFRYLLSKSNSDVKIETLTLEEISEKREAIGMKILLANWSGMLTEAVEHHTRCIFQLAACVGQSAKFPLFLHMCLSIYIVWSVVLLLAAIAAVKLDCYGSGELDPKYAYVWVHLTRAIFICPAVFPLLFVLLISSYRLVHRSPIKKFITIKAIVFINFWQGTIIAIIGFRHKPLEGHLAPEDDPNSVLNLFLLCFEMAALSFVSVAVFPANRVPLLVNPSSTSDRRGHWLWFLMTPQDVWRSAKLSWFKHDH